MKFAEALEEMKNGKCVALPEWSGYWFIVDGTIMIHCSDARVMDIRNTDIPIQTAEYMGRDDWEVVASSSENHTFYMTFGEALTFLRAGYKLRRDGWNENMFAVYQKGYPSGIPCNKQTAEAWGLNEGDLFKCNPYLQIKNADGTHSMWSPSVDDILATDWRCINGSKMS